MKTPSIRRRLLSQLRPVVPQLGLALICMLVLTLATAAAAELVGPVLRNVVLGTTTDSWLSRFLGRGLRASAWTLPGLLLALGLSKGLAYFGQFYLMGMVGQEVTSRWRRRILSALLSAGPVFLARQRTGDLLSRLSNDMAAVEMAVTYSFASYVRDGLTAVALFGLCVALDWRLSLIAFGLLPLTVGPLVPLARRLLKLARSAQVGQGDLGHRLAEGLQGLRLIQVDGLEAIEGQRFAAHSRSTLQDLERGARLRALVGPLMEVVAVVGLAATLWVASAEVARGAVSPEHLLSFLAAALLLGQPIKSLSKLGQFLLPGLTAAERLFWIEDQAQGLEQSEERDLPAVAPLRESLELRDIWFRYPTASSDAPRWVLQGIHLKLHRGERLGLVGESGSGKSSLVSLLLGLYAPDRGTLEVDGVDLAGCSLRSRRELFAWVGQDPLLLDLTVAENITLSDEKPDPARLQAAIAQAAAQPFVERGGGISARVGERGGKLSGGERQRLCLARAFYRNAPVLLLDEPTSQLDARSEEEIALTLDGELRGRTALVVAHRLATVRSCDRVLVMQGGVIAEEGKPEELLARGGLFAALMAGQLQPERAVG